MILREWDTIAVSYPGWSLEEIKSLTRRERMNWLEIRIKRGG